MKASLKWLGEYVDLSLDPEELARKLTLTGIEIDEVRPLAASVDGVVAGKIIQVEKHPGADRLVVCRVDVAQKEPLEIVTGAPNVAAGQIVPVAPVGTILPGGMKIKRSRLRGIDSWGMLCSARELGLDQDLFSPESRDGILILPQDLTPGTPLLEALDLDDQILEAELNPNRADCLAMVNLAREVAAVTGGALHLPEISVPEANTPVEALLQVSVEDQDLCGRYAARVVENIKVGPSPSWLTNRLRSAGIRSINNVVDVTNYVMLELGQPIHAFDYDLLKGHKIVVRRARPNEQIITLDGQVRGLAAGMLVIADAEQPVAVAGVMGGLASEVTAATRRLVIESAHFDGASVRRTARELGMRTEASSRFEKGVNIDGAASACDRVAQLLALTAGGTVASGLIDIYPNPWRPKDIVLRPQRVNQLLGTSLSTELIKNYLERLHFEIQEKDDQLLVRAGSYRGDITTEIDLVEEVARLYGFDQIPTTIPSGRPSQRPLSPLNALEAEIKDFLPALGLTEVITYSFINPAEWDRLGLPATHPWRSTVKILNPLSADQSVMRTTLLPGLLNAAARNFSYNRKDLAIFELGRVFYPVRDQPLPQEELVLGALVSGNTPGDWQVKPEPLDFYYLKGVVTKLLGRWQIPLNLKPLTDLPALHSGRAAIIMAGEVKLGFMGEIHPLVQKAFDFNQRLYYLELNLKELASRRNLEPTYRAVPRYPAVERDLALIVPEDVPAGRILDLIRREGGELLQAVKLFDLYRGEQVPPGAKSLAYSLTYQSFAKTLTDEEVNLIHQRIIDALAREVAARLR